MEHGEVLKARPAKPGDALKIHLPEPGSTPTTRATELDIALEARLGEADIALEACTVEPGVDEGGSLEVERGKNGTAEVGIVQHRCAFVVARHGGE
jgi:hypothetical protein